jgi:hypothetical protein
MKKRQGPVIRQAKDRGADQPRRSTMVEPKRKPPLDEYDLEEHRRAGEKADELFREIVRRVRSGG